MCKGKLAAAANVVDVLSKGLSWNTLNKARQVVGNVVHSDAHACTAPADADVIFFME